MNKKANNNRTLVTILVLVAVISLALVAAWPMLFPNSEASPGSVTPNSSADTISGETVVATIDDEKLLYKNFAPMRGFYAYLYSEDSKSVLHDAEFSGMILDMLVDQYFMNKYYQDNGIIADEVELEAELSNLLPYLYQGLDEDGKAALHLNYGFTDDTIRLILRGEICYNIVFEQLIAAAPLSEEDAHAFYNENPEYFTYAEDLWQLRHILVTTEPEAQSLLTRLGQGEDFATLATELSIDYSSAVEGGSLGTVTRGDMEKYVEPFKVAALALTQPGEISGAVYSEFGWHVLKLDDFTPQGTVISFEDIKTDLIGQLEQRQADEEFNRRIGELVTATKINKIYDAVYIPAPTAP